MNFENPLVALVRERESARSDGAPLNDAQVLALAISTRRTYDGSFRKLREVAQAALDELDQEYRPEGVATRLAENLLQDGKTEMRNPMTATVTDLVMAFPTLLRRIMATLSVDPINADDLRSLLNDLIAMAQPSHT